MTETRNECKELNDSNGSVPLGVARKAQHALAHGATQRQAERIIDDWLVGNGREPFYSLNK